MAGFRFPGPLNQMQHLVDINDGTSPRAPSPRPGPVIPADGPPPTSVYDHPELLSPGEVDALITERQALWVRIKRGLEREAALAEAWKASEREFAYLDDSLGFQPLSGRRLETAGEGGPEAYSSFMWKLSAERRRDAFQSALRRIPKVMEEVQKVNALFYLYDELCQAEFDSLDKSLKPSYGNPINKKGIKPGFEYYRWVRQFYFRQGIDKPAEYLNKEVKPAWFLGRPIGGGANTKMRTILQIAEKELDGMGLGVRLAVTQAIRHNPGGFVPRPIANRNALSNHALGQAVDFEPDNNPHLVDAPARAIDEVLSWLQSRGRAGPERLEQALLNICASTEVEAEETYRKMKAISDALQQFLQEWLQKWEEATARQDSSRVQVKKLEQKSAALEKKSQAPAPGKGSPVSVAATSELAQAKTELERAKSELSNAEGNLLKYSTLEPFANVEKLVVAWAGGNFLNMGDGIKAARFYRDHGVITLPKELFVAFRKAGARAGVDYHDSKDVMHFEVPP